jgi:hypothetical protein
MGYQLIEHIEVGSGGAASITFASIAADYTDLKLLVSARSTYNSTDADLIYLQFNGSSSGYSGIRLYGVPNGTVGSDANSGSGTFLDIGPISSALNTASTFGSTQCYIPNYRSSVGKSTSSESVSETNATTNQSEIYAGLWNNTDPITSITLDLIQGGNFTEYSTASLYGIV